MGLEFNEQRFARAVAACALEKDIASFPHGINVRFVLLSVSVFLFLT